MSGCGEASIDSCQNTRALQRFRNENSFAASIPSFDFEMDVAMDDDQIPETVQARFVSDTGEEAGPPLELPSIVTVSQLGRICNAILQNVSVEVNGPRSQQVCLSDIVYYHFVGRSAHLFILRQ